MPEQEEDTVDDVAGARFAEKFFDPSTHRLQLDFGAATHTGNVRTNNEDHYAIVERRRTTELILTNLAAGDVVLTDDADFAMVVADGMGGHNCGELASRVALQRMFELAQQATSWVMKYTGLEVQQIRERVEAYIQEIQATLREHMQADPARWGMGTTWTMAHLLPPRALVVQIGDSRAYLMHDGELQQVTRDETMAQAFIDSGMTPESVQKFRHMLVNSLGGTKDDVTFQLHHLALGPSDRLLLCSDGLTDMVSDEEIGNILRQTTAPQAACDKLVAVALANGGRDNVTVALAAASSTWLPINR
ncbi:MAG: protein phosphatase 2C domain-containing protein [Pirellulales bacterium]|nr:protein phosphatase 2C domain-containing protein [Pirellulales bacterium]